MQAPVQDRWALCEQAMGCRCPPGMISSDDDCQYCLLSSVPWFALPGQTTKRGSLWTLRVSMCRLSRVAAAAQPGLSRATERMLPTHLALVDDDPEFGDYLAGFLRERGVEVSVFRDGASLLTCAEPFEFPFYLLDLGLPGIDGMELLRVLRRRSAAGVLVLSGRMDADAFELALQAGADMYLAKPVRFEQVALVIEAVHRRELAARAGAAQWRLDRRSGQLIAPDGARVELSDHDLRVLECFVDAQGATVGRDALMQRLGQAGQSASDNLLHATIYRLRRRIEKATPLIVPLQSQARVGYVFRATLAAS